MRSLAAALGLAAYAVLTIFVLSLCRAAGTGEQ